MSPEASNPDKDKKYTVFVVDDSLDDRMLAVSVLKKSPYVFNVQSFESGDKLMEHFVEHGFYSSPVMRNIPLLILLDRHMPGTDGLGILHTLKEHPLTKDIPIVMLTSDASTATAVEAHRLQVNAFLQKPLQLSTVHDVILNGKSWPARRAITDF